MNQIKPWYEFSVTELAECYKTIITKGVHKQQVVVPVFVDLLFQKSCLKYAFEYVKIKLYYVYDKDQGIYQELVETEMTLLIALLLKEIDPKMSESTETSLIVSIKKRFSRGQNARFGLPQFDKGVLVFNNGTLILSPDQINFISWTPEVFINSRLEYSYNPKATCDRIFNFLHHICEGHKDRLSFLKCWLAATVRQQNQYQIFLYMYGGGGTGKSTFANLVIGLVGISSTITTSFKALNNDTFEITNLREKKLILINDAEFYQGNMAVLKALTGGDLLKGRRKFVQGSEEVVPEGMVLIVSNYPLGSQDLTSSVTRRLRVLSVNKTVEPEKRSYNLVQVKGKQLIGTLVPELPGMLNWVLSATDEEISDTLSERNIIKSLEETRITHEESINPLVRWIREELEPGEGSYIGYKPAGRIREDLEISRRKALFPTYDRWAKRNGVGSLSNQVFSSSLIENLNKEGYVVEKRRRSSGIYIAGVSIKPGVYDRDYIYGAPLQLEGPKP